MLQSKVYEIPRDVCFQYENIYAFFVDYKGFFSPMSTQWSPCCFPHLPDKKHCSRRNPRQNNFQQKATGNFFVKVINSYLTVSRKRVDPPQVQIILEVSQERLLWDKSNSSEKTKTENGNGNFCKLSQSNIKYPMQLRNVLANQVSVRFKSKHFPEFQLLKGQR